MEEKELEKLYGAVSKKFDVGTFTDFSSKMQTTKDRKKFYDVVGQKGLDLGDYNEYETRLGKANEVSSKGSKNTSATSAEPSKTSRNINTSNPFGGKSQEEFIGKENAKRIQREVAGKPAPMGLKPLALGNQPKSNIGYREDGLSGAFNENISGNYASPSQIAESEKLKEIQGAYQGNQNEIAFAQSRPNTASGAIVQAYADDELEGSRFGYWYNEILKGFGQLGSGIGDWGVQLASTVQPRGTTGVPRDRFQQAQPLTKEQEEFADAEIKDYRENTAPLIRTYLKETLGANVAGQLEAKYRNETVTSALGGLMNSSPAIGLNFVSGGLGSVAMSAQMFDNAIESINSTEEGRSLDEDTKTLFAGGVSLVSTMLEKYSLNKILKSESGIVSDYITRRAIRNASQATGGNITGDVLSRFLNKEVVDLSNKYAIGGLRALDASIVEYATESAQEGTSIAGELITNKATGKTAFNTKDLDSWEGFIDNIKRVNKAGVAGFIAGGALGSVSSLVRINKNVIDQKQQLIAEIDRNLQQENISETSQQLLIRNKLQLQKELQQVDDSINQTYNSLSEPQQERVNAVIEEKVQIQEALQDPAVSEEAKAELAKQDENLDKELSEIAPETTEVVPVKPSLDIETIGKKPVADMSQEEVNSEIEILQKMLNEGSFDKLVSGTGGTISAKAQEYVDKVSPVLQALFPNLTLKVYDTTNSYVENEGRSRMSAGVYNPETNTIGLNMELITKYGAENTVFHEAIHPIVSAVYDSNPQALSKAVEKLNSLENVAGMEKVFEHNSLYEGLDVQTRQIEAVTEFLNLVADNQINVESLNTTTFTKIKEFFNEILKTLGINYQISTAEDVVKLSQTIKQSFETKNPEPLSQLLNGKQNNVQSNVEMDALSRKEAEARLQELIAKNATNVQKKPSKTTKQTIKENTEKGTKGKVEMTTRQALKKQFMDFNRGIREGLSQSKLSQKEKDANLKQARTDLLKMVKAGLKGLKGVKVPVPTMQRLATIIGNANTISKLDRAVELVDKVIEDVNFIKKSDRINTLKGSLKRLSKRKGLPKELVQTFKTLLNVNQNYLNGSDLQTFTAVLNYANNLFKDPKAEIRNYGVEYLSQQSERGKLARQMELDAKKLTDKYQKAKIEELKQSLSDAGIDQNLIDTLSSGNDYANILDNLAELLDITVEDSGDTSIKETSKDKLKKVYNALVDNIFPEDFAGQLDEKSIEILTALKDFDVENLTDKNLFMAVAGLRNLQINGVLSNMGSVYANVMAKKAVTNQSRLDAFVKNLRIPSLIGSKITKALGSGTLRTNEVLNKSFKANDVLGFLGLTDYNIGYEKATRKIRTAKEEIVKVYKKYQKQIDNPKQQILMSVYADLSQYRASWTQEQIENEFEGRKQALKESIDRLDKDMSTSKSARARSSEYVNNLKEVYNDIKDLKNAEEIRNRLNEGQKKMYDAMRQQFEGIKSEMDYMASMYGQTSYESDWINYFPRSYEKLGQTTKDEGKLQNATDAVPSFSLNSQMNQTRGNKSGAVQGRVLTGDGVRQGHVVSYNALNNFFNTFNNSVYDINTIEERNYIAEILRDEKLVESVGEQLPLHILENIYVNKVSNDLSALRTGANRSITRQLLSSLQSISATQALGGLGQIIKQGIPALADTYVRLQSNPEYHLFNAVKMLAMNPEQVNALINNSAVSRRSISKVVLPTQDSFRIQQKTIAQSLGKLGIYGAKAGKLAQDIAMASLEYGDTMSAKVGWLSFYMEGYENSKGEGTFDINAPLDKDALAYANLKINTLANESDSSMKSEFSKNPFYSVFLPFASFAINSHLELGQSLARLRDGMFNENSPDYREIVHNVAGNMMAVASFHAIAYGLRVLAIKSAGIAGASILSAGVFATGDDDDEIVTRKQKVLDLINNKTQERLENNDMNSVTYFAQDAFWRGLSAGVIGEATKPLTNKALYELGFFTEAEKMKIDKAEMNNKPFAKDELDKITNQLQILGMIGIPFKNANDLRNVFKDAINEDFDKHEFQMGRFGQEGASGLEIIVPEDKKKIELDQSLKTLRNIEMIGSVASFLVPLQEVSTATRTLKNFDRKVRDAVYGKRVEDREDAMKLLETYRTINIDKEERILTSDQLDFALGEHQKVYNELYKDIKKELNESGIKDSKSEKALADLLKKEVKFRLIEKYDINFEGKPENSEDRMTDLKIQVKKFIKNNKPKK